VSKHLSLSAESVRQADVETLIALSDAYSLERYPPEGHFGADLDALDQPDITFLVARLDGQALGCGAAKWNKDGSAELKRLFVSDSARGHGVGRALMARLEQEAKARSITLLLLETGPLNLEALKLYTACGFAECGPFPPYEPNPHSLFFSKALLTPHLMEHAS
jgi:putative acetyltransferase